MSLKRSLAFAGGVLLAVLGGAPQLAAQGVTTGAISGRVTDPAGQPLEAVQVQIVNRATGFTAGTITRENGRYIVSGLEVGGPYNVTARRVGYAPQTRAGLSVGLSTTLRIDFQLETAATQLTTVTVTEAATESDFSSANKGTRTTVSDTVLQRLPTLTRNLTDFVRLTPQASASGPGFSGGGMSNRMNNVQIDGATERDVFGLGSTGQPGGQVSAKAISIDAVKEFQVLLAPFDVRQGNFGGLLLNAVTKSGTNDFTGSAYGFYRNETFGANVPALRATNFLRQQLGFSLGGPIIKDKLHFFTANEFQDEDEPVTGPYRGQPAGESTPFPIAEADLARLDQILASPLFSGVNLGTAGSVSSPQPMTNLFGRLDYQINGNHRLVFRFNYTDTEKENRRQDNRSGSLAVFSSNFHSLKHTKKAPVLQLFSNFANGWSNELFVGMNTVRDRRVPNAGRFPQITVNNVPSSSQRLQFGADASSQGNEGDFDTYELTNNLTIPRGNHTFVVGTRNELNYTRNLFAQNSYGVWAFRNLDSLAAGNANSYRRAFILANGGSVYFDALQTALYAQDQWQATPSLAFTFGVRADINSFLKDNDYAPAIDSVYGVRETPKQSFQVSPRFGFNWDVTNNQVNQLRGGVGLFVGTPPYVWLENAYINNGRIISNLNCAGTNAATAAPAFTGPDAAPTVCRSGQGTRPIGNVNFLDKSLKFPQPLRANLAFDRRLPGNLVATLEGLYSKTLNQFFFVNRNLAGPQGTDAHGRVINGTIGADGRANAVLPPAVAAAGGITRFAEAIDIVNQNKDYAFNLTGQLKKRYANNWEGMVAYTFSRARDVQSFTSSTHGSNWRFGRTLATAQETPTLGRSLFETPHRVLASGTYTLNWLRQFSTDFTIFYQGSSGAPHDYVYGGSGGRGDLNADNSQGNDLIYVPTNATDANQIRFNTQTFTNQAGQRVQVTAAQQAQAFESLIASSDCLSKNRGKIIDRNGCTQPWFNTVDLNIRQSLPTIRGQRVALQLDVFNFGNLLNEDWGKQRNTPATLNSNVPIITHVSQSSADPKTAVSVVEFNPFSNFRSWTPENPGKAEEYVASSNFSGNFWRMQLGVRYSF